MIKRKEVMKQLRNKFSIPKAYKTYSESRHNHQRIKLYDVCDTIPQKTFEEMQKWLNNKFPGVTIENYNRKAWHGYGSINSIVIRMSHLSYN